MDKKTEKNKAIHSMTTSVLKLEGPELSKEKHLWVVCFNKEGYMTCMYLAALGDIDLDKTSPAEIFSTAVQVKATEVILVSSRP